MNRKKIFDIVPPGFHQEVDIIKEIKAPTPKGAKSAPKVSKRLVLTVAAAFAFLLGVFYFSLNPSAALEVHLKGEKALYEKEITLEKSANGIDFDKSVIPAIIIQEKKSLTRTFPATGKSLKEVKARGKITIYNGYSTAAQPLVATTRFVSAEGKLFRIPKGVVVPGGHYEKGKLVPGTIEVEVVADQPGEEYNIGPSTFSIPGFAGTARYTAIYAKSFSPMTGGLIKEVSLVTEEDLKRARAVLENEIIEAGFRGPLPKGALLVKDTFTLEGVRTISTAKVNEEKESFNFSLEADLKALAFRESDFNSLVLDFLQAKVPQDKYLREESLKTEYSSEEFDLNQGRAILKTAISADLYPKIDQSKLKSAVFGTDPLSAKNYIITKNQGISSVKVNIWPFWIKKLPKSEDRISIEIILD